MNNAGLSTCLGLSAIFFLILASQASMTPLGEQMDLFGHIGYVSYISKTAAIPRPQSLTMPSGIADMQKILPAPDHGNGDRYRIWAHQSSQEREAAKIGALNPANLSNKFDQPNYESQQPPLYYLLMSRVYGWIGNLPLDWVHLILTLVSLLMVASAMPAIFLIMEQAFGSKAAILAAILIAWLPNNMAFFGRLTNDCLSFPLFCWAIYLLLRKNRRALCHFAALALIAAALFTKSYALTLLPFAFFCIWADRGKKSHFKLETKLLLSLFIALASASLFLFNIKIAGHWMLLANAVDSASIPLHQKLLAMICLDPIWFYFNGLIKTFWWSGFWSMVTPGPYYYFPLALFGGAAGYGFFKKAWNNRSFWNDVIPHLIVIIAFIAGIAWHAAMFEILARLKGTERSGNGGWYLLIIAPSIFLVLLSPLKCIWKEDRIIGFLRYLSVGMIFWNLLGRISCYMFWSGSVRLHHFMRGMDFGDTLGALFRIEAWAAFLSLPGIIHPAWLFSIMPLIIAILASIYMAIAISSMPKFDEHARK
jgi:hypothetical protein